MVAIKQKHLKEINKIISERSICKGEKRVENNENNKNIDLQGN